MTQREYYLWPAEGDNADLGEMKAKQPDVIAFNGYAGQYAKKPIQVKKGEKVRMYVLNAGPSIWSAFHVSQPRPIPGRLGRVHARRRGQLPVRHPRLRRHVKGAQGVLQTEGSHANGMGH